MEFDCGLTEKGREYYVTFRVRESVAERLSFLSPNQIHDRKSLHSMARTKQTARAETSAEVLKVQKAYDKLFKAHQKTLKENENLKKQTDALKKKLAAHSKRKSILKEVIEDGAIQPIRLCGFPSCQNSIPTLDQSNRCEKHKPNLPTIVIVDEAESIPDSPSSYFWETPRAQFFKDLINIS